MVSIEGHEELLTKILEDIVEKISSTLKEEERLGAGLQDQILDQIEHVQDLRAEQADEKLILQESKKLNAYHMLFWNWALESHAVKMKKVDPQLLGQIILSSFMLGVYRGNRFTLDSDDYFEFLDPITHQKVCAASRKARHEEVEKMWQKNIRPALKHAEKLWSRGDKRYHGQMADHLLTKYPKIKKESPNIWNLRKKLMAELIPIAKKFGKVRGYAEGQEPAYTPY